MRLLIKHFPYYARLLTVVALSILTTIALSGCSSDNAKESDSSSDAALLKVMGVGTRQSSPAGDGNEKGESLNMQIVEPDFDRNMAEPVVTPESRKGRSLDF